MTRPKTPPRKSVYIYMKKRKNLVSFDTRNPIFSVLPFTINSIYLSHELKFNFWFMLDLLLDLPLMFCSILTLDLESIIQVLMENMTHPSIPTRLAALRWVYSLLDRVPR